MEYGDFSSSKHRNLIWVEAPELSGEPTNTIATQDYFVLSDVSTSNYNSSSGAANVNMSGPFPSFTDSQTDNTAFTRVLKFESVTNESTTKVLTFTDLATGTKQVTFDDGGSAELIVGGITYKVDVESDNLSIDLNGDGSFYNGTAVVATEGGALMLLGIINTTDASNTNDGAGGSTSPFGDSTGFAEINISINTLSKMFDESSETLSIGIPFESRESGARLGIDREGTQGINLIFLTSEPEIAQALDLYGTFYELFDPLTSDTPEELTIEYPLSQRGAQVFVTAGSVQAEVVGGEGGAGTVQPLPVGTSKLATEVTDVTMYNSIVLGGPCANAISAQLMGSPEPCWEAIPENRAIVRLYEHANGNVALLVAGRTSLNTRQGARALLTGDISAVTDVEAEVTGTSVTEISVNAVV